MTRLRATPAFMGVLVAASLGGPGCGGAEMPSTGVAPPTVADVTRAVRQAAEAIWKSIDDYDAKTFAALSIDPKVEPARPVAAKDVESMVMDLHQRYGGRAHRMIPEPLASVAAKTAFVTVLIGEREDAVLLAFTVVAGAWKLSSVANADPQSVDVAPK